MIPGLGQGGRAGGCRGWDPWPYPSLPADVGTVLKVVSVPKESWHHMEPLLLEELQVFQVRGGGSTHPPSDLPGTPLYCPWSGLCLGTPPARTWEPAAWMPWFPRLP